MQMKDDGKIYFDTDSGTGTGTDQPGTKSGLAKENPPPPEKPLSFGGDPGTGGTDGNPKSGLAQPAEGKGSDKK